MTEMRDAILFRTAQEVAPDQMAGRVAVVIDVLRATTTIATAIAAGATRIIPCRSPEEALRERARLGDAPVVLGGERRGLKIAGFDLDNSPLAYTAAAVRGKTVVITTTNGTEAMGRAGEASELVAASFVNAATVCDWLAGRSEPLAFVCAGTEGRPSDEDSLCAGLLIARLQDRGCQLTLAPGALDAVLSWRSVTSLSVALSNCYHARYLTDIGFGADVACAARADTVAVLPIRVEGALVQGLR